MVIELDLCIVFINPPENENENSAAISRERAKTQRVAAYLERNSKQFDEFSSIDAAEDCILEHLASQQNLFLIIRHYGRSVLHQVATNYKQIVRNRFMLPIPLCFWSTTKLIGTEKVNCYRKSERLIGSMLLFCFYREQQVTFPNMRTRNQQLLRLFRMHIKVLQQRNNQIQLLLQQRDALLRQNQVLVQNQHRLHRISSWCISVILVSVLIIIYFLAGIQVSKQLKEKQVFPLFCNNENQEEFVTHCVNTSLWNTMEQIHNISSLNTCEQIIVKEFTSNLSKRNEWLHTVQMLHMSKIAFALGQQLEKQDALNLLQRNPTLLFYLRDNLKDDFEIAYLAFQNMKYMNHSSYKSFTIQLSSPLQYKNSTSVLFLHVVKESASNIIFASKKIQNQIEIVSLAVEQNPFATLSLDSSLRSNTSFINNTCSLHFASNRIINDMNFILELLRCDKYGWRIVFPKRKFWKHNVKFMKEAVKRNGRVLQHATKAIRDNKEIVLEAIKNDASAFQFASQRLKNDSQVITTAMVHNNVALDYASSSFMDRSVLISLLSQYNHPKWIQFPELSYLLSRVLLVFSKYQFLLDEYLLQNQWIFQHETPVLCNKPRQWYILKRIAAVKITTFHDFKALLYSGLIKKYIQHFYWCNKDTRLFFDTLKEKSSLLEITQHLEVNNTLLLGSCQTFPEVLSYLKETNEEEQRKVIDCIKHQSIVTLPHHLKNSKAFLLNALEFNYNIINYMKKDGFIEEKEYALHIVKYHAESVEWSQFSQQLQSDMDIQLQYIHHSKDAFSHPKFNITPLLLLKLIQQHSSFIDRIPWSTVSTEFFINAVNEFDHSLTIRLLHKSTLNPLITMDTEFWTKLLHSHFIILYHYATISNRNTPTLTFTHGQIHFCESRYSVTVPLQSNEVSDVTVCAHSRAGIEIQFTTPYTLITESIQQEIKKPTIEVPGWVYTLGYTLVSIWVLSLIGKCFKN